MAGQEHLGPLTTTFLLALATPIITLPVERIERSFGQVGGGYMNDRPLNDDLAAEIHRVFGLAHLNAAPFFHPDAWRFATTTFDGENLAMHLPDGLTERLSAADSVEVAARMPVSQWASCVRNALAHGGVLYVDREGKQTQSGETEGFIFVSAKYPKGDLRQPPERLNALRISEVDFRSFLTSWVDWLSRSGLSQALSP